MNEPVGLARSKTESVWILLRRERLNDNRIQRSRKTRSIRQNNAKTKMDKSPIPTVQELLKSGSMGFYSGPFKLEIEIHGKCRADIDNVLKGIADALNGVAYRDDRQMRRATIGLFES